MQKNTSKPDVKPRTGGVALAEQLSALGVDRIFTVPGETFIAALDGLYDQADIQTIVCRNEGGAAMMAEAHAKLTGRPGVVFVTRAPGLANAISGLVVARQDHSPLLLLVGLPGTSMENRGDLQSFEFERVMGAFTKSVSIVRDPDRIPEVCARTYTQALSDRPGPVAIGLPEDCLNETCMAPVITSLKKKTGTPTNAQLAAVAEALDRAAAPLVIIGGGPWSEKAQRRIESIAELLDLPVAASFRCQDFMDNRHPCYVGHLGIAVDASLAAGVRSADLIIAIGANLGDVSTGGYHLMTAPETDQTLIHVMPSADDLSKAIEADHAIVCSPQKFLKALAKRKVANTTRWTMWRQDLRAAYVDSQKPIPTPGQVQLEQVVLTLSDLLPDDAIVTNGAGNYAQFVHRYFRYKGFRTCLAPAAGSMGYGLPAAIAAKLTNPERTVVAFAGDGCLMMTVQELATAVQYGANIIAIVANNGMLGTIRMHQEQRFPGRVIATTLSNPDFVQMAESFGVFGQQVKTTEDFAPAFEHALTCNRPALVELLLDPDAITPQDTLSNIRNSGL